MWRSFVIHLVLILLVLLEEAVLSDARVLLLLDCQLLKNPCLLHLGCWSLADESILLASILQWELLLLKLRKHALKELHLLYLLSLLLSL